MRAAVGASCQKQDSPFKSTVPLSDPVVLRMRMMKLKRSDKQSALRIRSMTPG